MTTHDDLARVIENFLAAFNAGDAAALDDLYEPDSVLVPRAGYPATGQARSAANGYLIGFGVPMHAELRHAYVVGELALLIVDWSVRGTAKDGRAIDFDGTATDVLRRGDDGAWRYVIDNPAGIS